MKTAICLFVLLQALARAATIEGALFRFAHQDLVVDSLAVRGANPLGTQSREMGARFIDYRCRFGAVGFLIREGDVIMVDPETMDAPVLFWHEEEKGGFRVHTLVCQYGKEFAAGIMITRLQAKPDPDSINSGVYLSLRGADLSALRTTLRQVVSGAELSIRYHEFTVIADLPIAGSLSPLSTFLEKRPNKALEPTTTSVTDRAAHAPRQP